MYIRYRQLSVETKTMRTPKPAMPQYSKKFVGRMKSKFFKETSPGKSIYEFNFQLKLTSSDGAKTSLPRCRQSNIIKKRLKKVIERECYDKI